jgi:hypothetical protein
MALRLKSAARVRRGFVRLVLKLLTTPLKNYSLKIPNDLVNLKRYIRKGDVVLVEGNERISEAVKYLTQSSWSHAAIYVGDEALRRDHAQRDALLERFGAEAEYLLVEALVEEGVVLAPLIKYRDFNIRICRPFNLTRLHLSQVLDDVLGHVGDTYDLRNIFDLARYFLPVTMVPRRFRRKALNFGSGEPTRVICSSLLANAFLKVRYPILPEYLELPSSVRPRGLLRRLDPRRFGLLQSRPAGLVTPRDFDLSPYFEVIKFNLIEAEKFDYRRLQWAESEGSSGALEKRGLER